MRADEADGQTPVRVLHRLGDPAIGLERRRAGMQDREFVLRRRRQYVIETEASRRRIDQPAPRNQRRRLSEPRRIPEGADLTACLIAGAGAAVEALEEGGFRKASGARALLSSLLPADATAGRPKPPSRI